MDEKADSELLREYAKYRSEAAFRELVNRYTDLVYSAALRQVVSADAARDVAQEVFTDLAAKAKVVVGKSAGEASLAGWLYRSTRFLALNYLRDERRRMARERQVMEQTDLTPAAEPEWDRIRPILDEAMSDLNETDRDALLLRFFKNRDFRAIGQSLGLSDDAAQKRVSRALEKLRAEFARRGVTTSAVALSTALSANAVTVAPSGFATVLSTSALAGTAATSTTVHAVAMTTIQKTLIAVTFAAAVGAGVYEAKESSTFRAQIKSLQLQQTPLVERIRQLEGELGNATNEINLLSEANSTLKSNSTELLKLRGDVGLFQRQLREERQRSVTNQPRSQGKMWSVGEILPRNSWANMGSLNAQAAIQTFWWAAASKKLDEFSEVIALQNGKAMSRDSVDKFLWFRNDELQRNRVDAVRLTALIQETEVNATVRFELLRFSKESNQSDVTVVSGEEYRLMLIEGHWKVINDESRKEVSLRRNPEEAVELLSRLSFDDLEQVRTNVPSEMFNQIIESKKNGSKH